MGLNQTDKTFVYANKGVFEVRAEASDERSKMRLNAEKQPFYYIEYRRLRGWVVGVYINANKKGNEFLHIHVKDKGEIFVLCLYVKSNEANAFFQTMENIDYDKSISFYPYINKVGSRWGMNVSQSEQLNWKYTKDNPQGKPDWVRIEDGGPIHWDRSKELEFFKQKLVEIIHPILRINVVKEEENPIVEDVDDLPF